MSKNYNVIKDYADKLDKEHMLIPLVTIGSQNQYYVVYAEVDDEYKTLYNTGDRVAVGIVEFDKRLDLLELVMLRCLNGEHIYGSVITGDDHSYMYYRKRTMINVLTWYNKGYPYGSAGLGSPSENVISNTLIYIAIYYPEFKFDPDIVHVYDGLISGTMTSRTIIMQQLADEATRLAWLNIAGKPLDLIRHMSCITGIHCSFGGTK